MGTCLSVLSPEEKAEIDNSRLIDKANRDDVVKSSMVVKLLLVGAGESGKSTIFKQMRILYGHGFSESERMRFKFYIWTNILETVINGKNIPINLCIS
jgi:hypothetical protein